MTEQNTGQIVFEIVADTRAAAAKMRVIARHLNEMATELDAIDGIKPTSVEVVINSPVAGMGNNTYEAVRKALGRELMEGSVRIAYSPGVNV